MKVSIELTAFLQSSKSRKLTFRLGMKEIQQKMQRQIIITVVVVCQHINVQLYPASYEALIGDMLRFYPNKMKKLFFTTLKFSVNGLCLAFVIWQTIQCMTRYVQKPQGTIVTMEKSSNVPFPSITVCGSFTEKLMGGWTKRSLNKTYLKEVCDLRYTHTI